MRDWRNILLIVFSILSGCWIVACGVVQWASRMLISAGH